MPEGEKVNFTAEFNKNKEELLAMDETEFRARFRERTHHTLEIQTYANAYRRKVLSPNQDKTVQMYLEVWRERGLSEDLPEYVFAQTLLSMAYTLMEGGQVNLAPYVCPPITEEERAAFERVLYERRSVREWKRAPVPDEVLNKVLEAGLWAAHACNLQSIRYLVVREETTPGLFRGSDIPGGPVHIVVLQDMRVYRANPVMPESNQLLDAGAAAQNLVLAAYAYGLGGCWLTFTSQAMKDRIRQAVDLPDHYRMTTYVDVGWPDQSPYPPQRLGLEEAIIKSC
ncbi:nitroreductase family protein [Flavonifractor sp. AGMB03687]|uniref:nitroreductase family protein n=1 Tax=Flavonifractor sp. AGMB03687 TaxID=2785133 RepID=UPI001AE0D499|nr:nitroreductase family protein [Flavonifractor sp. AGMB03687]